MYKSEKEENSSFSRAASDMILSSSILHLFRNITNTASCCILECTQHPGWGCGGEMCPSATVSTICLFDVFSDMNVMYKDFCRTTSDSNNLGSSPEIWNGFKYHKRVRGALLQSDRN